MGRVGMRLILKFHGRKIVPTSKSKSEISKNSKKKKIHICLFISVTTKTTKIRAVLVSGE